MNIRQRVESLCRRHQCRDPFQLCREKNILVLYEPLGSVRGYYSYSYRSKVIHINEALDEAQQRFTCAHELGHAMLHPKANTPFLRANTLFSVSKLEIEANRFAVCLLYPQDWLKREFEGCSSLQVAESLKLPQELAEYALKCSESGARLHKNTR